MRVDAQNLFSDAQAVTASAASTNIIDLGENRDIGTGRDIYLVIGVDVAFTDAGSDSTVTVAIEKDTVEGFGSPETAQTIGTFAALSAVGTQLIAKLQPLALDQRFIRLQYTVANGNLTTGSFTAFLTIDIQRFRAYADNVTFTT